MSFEIITGDITQLSCDAMLELAQQFGCKTVAFPLLGAGNCSIPYYTAMGIAVREISAFLLEHDLDVTLVLFNQPHKGVKIK